MDRVDYLVCPKGTPEEREAWEQETLEDMHQETTDFDKIDYHLDKECKVPISYAMCKTEEDFVEWYAHHHPELPSDIAAIAARATANPTPLPSAKKAASAGKPDSAAPAFNIEHGEVTVDFS